MKTVVVLALSLLAAAAHAETQADPQLAAALSGARVSLEQGLSASSKEGSPISAKYELEVDGLQLSVYTLSSEGFKEVIVDHRTGRIEKAFVITDAKDLGEAKEQTAIMRHAKRSLQDVTREAVSQNAGYRAVSAMPGAKDGRLAAEILLTNGKEWRTVYAPLDWSE